MAEIVETMKQRVIAHTSSSTVYHDHKEKVEVMYILCIKRNLYFYVWLACYHYLFCMAVTFSTLRC